MWPLGARDVVSACGATCDSIPLDGVSIAGVSGSLHDLERGDLFVALRFADADAHVWVEEALSSGAALALVSASWAGRAALTGALQSRCVAVADVLVSLRRLAAVFRRRYSYPVAAVCGSNGKTTTKEMLSAFLAAPGYRIEKTPGTDNGFIGLPRTLCARSHRSEAPLHGLVLEIGIDAKGAMAQHARMVAADLVVVTALGPEHLDGLGDVATAVTEELRLAIDTPAARRVLPLGDPEIERRPDLLRSNDVAVIDAARLGSGAERAHGGARLVYDLALHGEVSDLAVAWYPDGPEPAWRGEVRVPMPGAHNARNCALALAAALALGRSPAEVMAGWQAFEPPAGRSRLVPLARGALLYDDCFNASPLGVEAALATLGGEVWAGRPKLAILGDMLDLGTESTRYHRELTDALAAVPGLELHCFGQAMSALGEHLRASGSATVVRRIQPAGDPADLVTGLDLPAGAIVLVKGSRAMRMERAVHAMESQWRFGAPPQALTAPVAIAAVTGSYGARAATDMISAALACLGPRFTVVLLPHASLPSPSVAREIAVGVFTGLSEADLPPGSDAESHLAQKAQLFAGRLRLRAAVLDADDPASELMAEVVPPGVQILRYGTAGTAGTKVDLLATAVDVSMGKSRVVLAGPAGFPGAIELGGGAESVRGAMAACSSFLRSAAPSRGRRSGWARGRLAFSSAHF